MKNKQQEKEVNEEDQQKDKKKKSTCLGPNMGVGQKYDFTKEGNRYKSGPASYSIPSIFDMNRFKAKGANFRISRKQAAQNSYLQGNMNPGPNRYRPETAKLSEVTTLPSYSMPRGPLNYQIDSKNPAPNAYNQNITYTNSKHFNKGNPVIQPVASLKFYQNKFFETGTSWKLKVENKLNL